MNQVATSNTESNQASSGMTALQKEEFEYWKDAYQRERDIVEHSLQAHECELVSREFAAVLCLAKYFELINKARLSLQGFFTEDEVFRLVNSLNYPRLESWKVLAMYYSDMVEEILPEDSDEYRLCVKLAGLSDIQQAAVVDVMECAWSDGVVGPFAYAMKHLGVAHSEVA